MFIQAAINFFESSGHRRVKVEKGNQRSVTESIVGALLSSFHLYIYTAKPCVGPSSHFHANRPLVAQCQAFKHISGMKRFFFLKKVFAVWRRLKFCRITSKSAQ